MSHEAQQICWRNPPDLVRGFRLLHQLHQHAAHVFGVHEDHRHTAGPRGRRGRRARFLLILSEQTEIPQTIMGKTLEDLL